MKLPETPSISDLGRKDTAAHTGAVDNVTKQMGYQKQIVTDVRSALEFLGGAGQLRTVQSISAAVEEGAFLQFSIGLIDIDGGPLSTDDIDISGISVAITKSTGGGAFSGSGLTVITFGEASGRVYVDYEFLAAEWAVGDVYKVEVSGIEATVGGQTAYVPAMTWCNLVVEEADIRAAVDQIEIDTDPAVKGRLQIAATTINLNQGAAAYVLFTGATQAVVLESLVIRMPNEVAGGALTSIAIATDDVTPSVILNAVDGAVANLTEEAQLAWEAAMGIYIPVGTEIELTIAGGAHGSSYVCNVVAKYRSVVSGGGLT